jgi:hypothetical protein
MNLYINSYQYLKLEMSRFSQVRFHPLNKKDPEEADIIEEQKTLKLKDAVGREVSVGSKIMLPNPKEEGLVVAIDDDDVIVRMAPPHRKGPASEVSCVRKCGRKPKAPKPDHPKPKVRFAKTAKKSRRSNNNNNNNADRLKFLLKALKAHNASKSKSRAKTARKSRRNNNNNDD